eukprot:GILI01005648.1.p1 GENE.GILI01005648.1~~GILI01005648.1.p1  ORF type:complete len:301 (+),score=117.83 GILI01005648.1:96-998(+)
MMRPGSALVRGKPKVKAATGAVVGNKKTEVKKPQLEDFLKEQNYTGAITLLEFERRTAEQRPNLLLWLAYCLFHNGDYKKAIDTFDEILRTGSASASSISASTSASLSLSAQMLSEVRAYKACCLYALCMYEEAEAEALMERTDAVLRIETLLSPKQREDIYKKLLDEIEEYESVVDEVSKDSAILNLERKLELVEKRLHRTTADLEALQKKMDASFQTKLDAAMAKLVTDISALMPAMVPVPAAAAAAGPGLSTVPTHGLPAVAESVDSRMNSTADLDKKKDDKKKTKGGFFKRSSVRN